MTIARIQLRNFKRFETLSLTCKGENILVGPNNCGKSSILDALRILYGAIRNARPRAPRVLDLGEEGVLTGYRIPVSAIPITLKNISHNYDSEDAILDFTHKNGTQLRIRLNSSDEPLLYIQNRYTEVKSGSQYFSSFPIDLIIVPTLAPFDEEEEPRTRETVVKNRSTRLAARNFRNIWRRAPTEEFDVFRTLVEQTWPGVTINPPEDPGGNGVIPMFFSEHRYDREIYWAGFGFQVWLQILTHILRGNPDSTIIIDEPDVYLHPDLQRRLLKLLRERYAQFFLATHSTEIVNDADVGAVVAMRSDGRSPIRITKDSEYQALLDYLGSTENVELSKLARAKRILFFEGKDRKILSRFANKVSAGHTVTDSDTLILAAGGFSQWRRVSETAWTFKNVLNIEAKIYAVFDRDFRPTEEIDALQLALQDTGIGCHVWRRKEVENYAICPDSICRLIRRRLSAQEIEIDDAAVTKMLLEISDEMRAPTLSQAIFHAEEYARASKAGGHRTTVMETSIKEFEKDWKDLNGRLRVVGGKALIGAICRETQDRYGVSISFSALLDEIRPKEVDAEVHSVLKTIDRFFET